MPENQASDGAKLKGQPKNEPERNAKEASSGSTRQRKKRLLREEHHTALTLGDFIITSFVTNLVNVSGADFS